MWRSCLSFHGRKGMASQARRGCTDPIFSGSETGQKMPEGETEAQRWVVVEQFGEDMEEQGTERGNCEGKKSVN